MAAAAGGLTSKPVAIVTGANTGIGFYTAGQRAGNMVPIESHRWKHGTSWNHVFKWRDLDPQISANLFGSLIDGVSTSFLHIIKIPFPPKKTLYTEKKHDHPLSSQNQKNPKLTPPQKKTQTPPILPTISPNKNHSPPAMDLLDSLQKSSVAVASTSSWLVAAWTVQPTP